MSQHIVYTSLIALATAGAAYAQESKPERAEDKSAPVLEDVIVTARRTNEAVQTTPIAITAFTERSLDLKQVQDVSDLQRTTPNLIFTRNQTGMGISLRGQFQVSGDIANDQSIGVYVDGVYIARQNGVNFDLIDVERVEILRGPQGTLFGRNTTGGAVSIITKKPTDELGAWVRAGLGNYGSSELAGVVNVPLTEALSIRVVGQHKEHDGYGRNVNLNRDMDDLDYDYVRGTLKLAPSDRWSLLLGGEYGHWNTNGVLIKSPIFNPARVPADALQYLNLPLRQSAAGAATFGEFEFATGTATLEVELVPGFNFRSISSIRDVKTNVFDDFDGTPFNLLTNNGITDVQQITQEVHLHGESERLKWLTGFFYFEESGEETYDLGVGRPFFDSEIEYESWAPFVQSTYEVADDLNLTAGVRYTKDTRQLTGYNKFNGACFASPLIVVDSVTCKAPQETSFDYVSYTASLDYQINSDTLVYVRTGKANKSGGFNKSNNLLETFGPETVVDYEVGLKADLADRLRINAAGFVSNYEDMQRQGIYESPSGVPVPSTISIGKARLYGVELEATALPISNLEISGTLGLIDPEYLDFTDASGDRSGEPYTRVSKVTWSLSGTYTARIRDTSLVFHTDYSHQSDKWFYPVQRAREPGYGMLNAKLSLTFDSFGLEVSAWGRNLTDKSYFTDRTDFFNSSGILPSYVGAPRTYGISTTYKFGGERK